MTKLIKMQIDEYNMENEHSITTKCYDVPALGCPSIVIVTEGEATPFADISADQSRSLSAEDTRASFLAQVIKFLNCLTNKEKK
jgi:hypothetical protein